VRIEQERHIFQVMDELRQNSRIGKTADKLSSKSQKTPQALGFYMSRTRNILVAHMFLRLLVKRYGRKPLYMDEASWYPLAARWTGLRHYVYGEDLKNVMERFIETVKDRLECFDDYFPCLKEPCNCRYVHNWFSVYALIYNQVRVHMTLDAPPLEQLDDIEAQAF